MTDRPSSLSMRQLSRLSAGKRKQRDAHILEMVRTAFAGVPIERRLNPQSNDTAKWVQIFIRDELHEPELSLRMVKYYLKRLPGVVTMLRMKAAHRGAPLPSPEAFPELSAEERRELREGAWKTAKRRLQDVKPGQK